MVGREAAVGRIAYSVNVVKYRPHRPHRSKVLICRTFLRSVLSRVITLDSTDRYDGYLPRIDHLEMSRFAGLSPRQWHRSRCGRYFSDFYSWGHKRLACILRQEYHRCTWPATTSTPTRTPGGVLHAAAYASTSPTTISTLPWLSARRFPTTQEDLSPT